MRVALTGGIASGKSQATQAFNALGIQSVDADEVVRDLLAPGSTLLNQIAEVFGPETLLPSGEYNRTYMRERVFASPEDRAALNALVHPAVGLETDKRLGALTSPYALWAIPLLVETQQVEKADRVIVVDVPETLQIERLMARDNATPESAQKALAAQASRQQRLDVADFVIDNSGTFDELKEQVKKIHQDLMALV